MKILGVNGAPNVGGTVDQMLQTFMGEITDEKEIVLLREKSINPCMGCLKCVGSNRCMRQDDWDEIQSKLMEADMLVLGCPTYYSDALGINAMTHVFLERWFALRHLGIKLKLKKVVVLMASASGKADRTESGLKNFFEFYHGIPRTEFIIAQGTMPCMVCGEGETCPTSGFVLFFGAGKKITPDLLPSLDKQPEIIASIKASASNSTN